MRPIPHGWLKYQAIGQCVSGTRLIPFKVPLKPELCHGRIPEEEWFTPAILLQKQPRLKTIIDLTDTQRYYDPQEFESNGVTHIKINITGGGRLPPPFKMREFSEAVDAFMKKYSDDPDALIGVHCTHGLNRTGYFICNYMVDRLKISPEDAISQFQSARGYEMERKNFVDKIKGVKEKKPAKKSKPTRRDYNEYYSPLCGSYEEESRRVDFRNRPSFPRENYRRGVGTRSHIEQSYRGYGYGDQQATDKNQIPPSNVDRYQRNNVWHSWQASPYSRNFGNQDSASSSSRYNWRARP